MKKVLLFSVFMAMTVVIAAVARAQTLDNAKNKLPEIGVVASDALTIDKEVILGDAIMKQLRGQAPLINDPVIEEYIQDLGNRLVLHADNTRFPFKFFIVNNPVLNAFAFYGGYIGIHSGLITRAQSESELASVVAHEIAHVTQRHLARRAQSQSRSGPLQLASLLGSILVALADPEAGVAAMQATLGGSQQAQINFTRGIEREADNIGISILYRAGFDPKGAPAFFGRLAEQARSSSVQLAFLRTHPLPQERVAETITRANAFGERKVAPSLSFGLVRARLNARYLLNEERALQVYSAEVERLTSDTNRNKASVALKTAKYGHAIALFENEKFEDAQALILELLKDDAENLFYLDLYTDVLLKQQKHDAAIKMLTSHWQHRPQNRVLALNLANTLLYAGEFDESIQILRDMLLVDSEDLLAYQLLHDAYRQSQNKKDAHITQANIYALISAYPLAINELQFAYNFSSNDTLERQRITGMIEKMRNAQETTRRLSL
ncbi:MAG: M48 family metalloprotease [Pseudomonadota bacterium]